MKTSERTNRPDRLEFFSNDWGDRDDPDDHMETKLNVKQNKAKLQEKTR